ncbi:hypothetical protein FA13DRAFT_40295 [Coprinellus micaceus]|uniref:Uncharacterized protein n=1 Tax=Coprinellus micaceus TaxID=71717 RepID=A0A4Y7U0I8_COPMI|nr:hypothetical protein FA13DRAFT_40295 [Coprinellus micaceus]
MLQRLELLQCGIRWGSLLLGSRITRPVLSEPELEGRPNDSHRSTIMQILASLHQISLLQQLELQKFHPRTSTAPLDQAAILIVMSPVLRTVTITDRATSVALLYQLIQAPDQARTTLIIGPGSNGHSRAGTNRTLECMNHSYKGHRIYGGCRALCMTGQNYLEGPRFRPLLDEEAPSVARDGAALSIRFVNVKGVLPVSEYLTLLDAHFGFHAVTALYMDAWVLTSPVWTRQVWATLARFPNLRTLTIEPSQVLGDLVNLWRYGKPPSRSQPDLGPWFPSLSLLVQGSGLGKGRPCG